MEWAGLLLTYKYWFVALGVIIADVPTLLLVGYFITKGYLDLVPALVIAILSRAIFDLVLFSFGRNKQDLGDRYPFLQKIKLRIKKFTKRREEPLVFTYHFIQGMKLGTPIVFGMGSIRPERFATLNIAAITLWVSIMIGLGFVFGTALI